MNETYRFIAGDQPLLISVPHDGRLIPDDIDAKMTPAGRAIPDTDWHVAKLYDFARALGASLLIASNSRYVVDLNRAADDAPLYPGMVATGLCPHETFAGDAIYASHRVDAAEQRARVSMYWQPYHDRLRTTLDAMRQQFGYALLWDAHSIPGTVPRLFDGDLPLLNLGSNDGRSTTPAVQKCVFAAASASPYSSVLNGRFKGGFITRHYGQPDAGVHALQLEIAQRAYMDESTLLMLPKKTHALRDILWAMLMRYQEAAQK